MDFQAQTGNASLRSESENHIYQQIFIERKEIEMHTWAVESECRFECFALIFGSFAGWLINFCLTFQNQPATNYQYVFHATSVATFVYFLHDITA